MPELIDCNDDFFADNDLSFFDDEKYTILPGFCDVHVHFREPGFFYKETIETGSKAAARGGYTAVCTMPNLNPVCDSVDSLKMQTDIIEKDGVIAIYPYCAITKGSKGQELVDFDALAQKVVAFSDDGKGVQRDDIMEQAMLLAKKHNKIIVAHCEDESLLHGGYVHLGDYCKAHNHKGICSESEFLQVQRDLELVKKTGCAYHVCHVSAKESVEAIRQAKAQGLDVTCETAPHYLLLDDSDLQEHGSFKMNPPLRSKQDKLALIQGVLDGTIDMIACDHAPHSEQEKSKGLKNSLFGIVGIETTFQLLYTYFVKTNGITLEKLLELIAINPRKRFNIPYGGFSVWNLNETTKICSKDFLSKGKSTPFENYQVKSKNYLTVYNGKIIYKHQI